MSHRRSEAKRLKSLLFLLALSMQAPSYAANQSPELQQGIASYNGGDHQRAISYLQVHLAKNQGDDVAHYYLANSFLKLQKTDEAMAEYRKAYDLSKSPQLRSYCLTAIQKNESTRARPSAPVARHVTDEDVAMSKTLDRIRQQTEIVKTNYDRVGSANAKDFKVRGQYDGYQLVHEREAKIRALQEPMAIDIYGRPIYRDRAVVDAEIEQVKKDYAARIEEARRIGEQEAAAHRAAVARDSSKFESEVSHNLQSQLTNTRRLPGTPVLQSAGTSLYTRQYGDPRSSGKKEEPIQDELLATPEKMILDQHSKPGKYRVVKEPVAQDQAANAGGPGTNLKVRGKLIRK